jgi:hypothetical protein
MCVQNGPSDLKSPNMGMCTSTKTKRDSQEQDNCPLTNSDLANNYTKWFQMFVKSINFDTMSDHIYAYIGIYQYI